MAHEQEPLREYVGEMEQIQATLDAKQGDSSQRAQRFDRLQKRLAASADPVRQQMAGVMAAFVGGLFVGDDVEGVPQDDLDLERWFRLPKGHERRIHGHRHAGVRIVQEGATLMLALDAHLEHPGPFCGTELLSYREAQPPPDEQEALHRRKVMRKARSQQKRQRLLAELELRYRNGP